MDTRSRILALSNPLTSFNAPTVLKNPIQPPCFFVPLAYHAFALQEIANGAKLAEHTADELNSAFGIPLKKKKGNALR